MEVIHTFRTLISIYKIVSSSFHYSHGKTTLLRHIASRAFAIPPNIDILYCEQEVVADDTPAVEEVLKADVKRTSLLQECMKLEAEQEKGNMDIQARLKEVLLL
jgi:ATP-binding cassette subfamily F protein 1